MIDVHNARITALDRLLKPRSIALIGASATPGSFGLSVLANLESAGYAGDLHLVNPRRAQINGRPCLSSIGDLPQGVDCAVLAIPGAAVLDAARACALKGVGSLIVFAAGFAESGAEGQGAQRELALIAREHSMIVEGPNCLGMVNYRDGIPLTFVVTPPQPRTTAPGAAIISQSGALAAVIAVNMRHHRIPLTYSITTGNEAATSVEDFVDHLIADDATRVLALVVEQFRHPRRFLECARQARAAGKFIVLLHPGSSQAARASSATHTGAMAGDYELMRTLVRHAGVIHVDSLEELVDVTQILVRISELPRAGAAVFTESGAFKALALDLCERIGLALPALSASAEQALRAALPPFIPPSNPLDLTAQGLIDPDLYRRTLPAVLEEDRFGSVLLGIILTDATTTALKLPPILDALRTLRPHKPLIFAALDEGAPFDAPGIDELRQLGVACFPSPERALRALGYVTTLGARESDGTASISQRTTLRFQNAEKQNALKGHDFSRAPSPQITSRALAPEGRLPHASPTIHIEPGLRPEYQSKRLLAQFGIAIPIGRLARTLDEAIVTAREIGFPLVLKAQSADLPHKSDAGGVILGIDSEPALVASWHTLHRNVHANRPDLALDGVLVERMSNKGFELIVGARNDPDWGPVLLIGSGGILAEAMRDVRLLPPDLSPGEIQQELLKLKCSALFHGFRGSPAIDIEAAANIVHAVGELIRSTPQIEEIDINPVVVYPVGHRAIALDALIAVRSS